MKSATMIGAVALAAGVAGTSSAFAQDNDWSVTLGIKGWANVWESGQLNTLAPYFPGSNWQSYTSGSTWAALPSVAVKYKDFFISSSYFTNTKYGFPAATALIPVGPTNDPSASFVTQDISAKRKEFDINIGWYFVPQVAVTLGYKQVDQKFTNTVFFGEGTITPPPSTTKNKAPTIGIVAGAPIGNSDFLMYLNAASSIGPNMKATFSDGSPSWKGWYASGELGFGYRIAPGLTGTLGYKYQFIDYKADTVPPTQRGRDTTNGPTLGLAYTFGAVASAPRMAGSSSAFGQNKDWSVTLGLKGWANVWQTTQINSFSPYFPGSNAQSSTSDTTWAAIPSVAVRYKDFLISSSYFINTTYDFPASATLVPVGDPPVVIVPTQNTSSKRKEFDINIGWSFVPQAAVTLGYKQINRTFTDDFDVPGFGVQFASSTKYKAPTIGILAGAPIGDSDFLMYLNAASSIGPSMKATVSGSDDSWKGWYASGELGFGYRIVPGLTATLGYKYQIINIKVGTVSPTQRARDTTNGPILGVAYTF